MIPKYMGSKPGIFLPWGTPSAINVVADGDSLTSGGTASGPTMTYPAQLARLGTINSGLTITNLGVSGQRIDQMTSNHADVDAAWVAGKTYNVLLVWEMVNSSAFGRTAAQIVSDLTAYIAAVKGAHPWKVVLFTGSPFFDPANTQANTNAFNAVIRDANATLRSTYLAMGADYLVDVVPPGSPLGDLLLGGDYSAAAFSTSPLLLGYWNSTEASTGKYIHLKDSGYGQVAAYANAVLPTMTRA